MDKQLYALVSVSNKRGIENLARGLVDLGYRLLSTGGTAKAISTAGLPVTLISDFVGEPELLRGSIKTLHPKIHASILAEKKDGLFKELESLHAVPIDLVVVNMRSFEYAVARPSITLDEALACIDLGGSALLRSAARNFKRVAAVCDPSDYEQVLWHLAKWNKVSDDFRFELAIKALSHTTAYDAAVLTGLADFRLETGLRD